MPVSQSVRGIKQLASELSPDELNHLVGWCYRLAEKKQRDKDGDSTSGIVPKSALKTFRQMLPLRRGRIALPDVTDGATVMLEFYEKTRIKGCRFEDDADMLLVEWGLDGGKPFISITRQIIPPQSEDQIWQLSMDYWYKRSDSLKGISSGNKWFRSLHDIEALSRFIYCSRVVSRFSKLQPSKILLTYKNVE